MSKEESRFTYDIVYNKYLERYVVFKMDNVHFYSKGIFTSQKKKECVEWLKSYKNKCKNKENCRSGE